MTDEPARPRLKSIAVHMPSRMTETGLPKIPQGSTDPAKRDHQPPIEPSQGEQSESSESSNLMEGSFVETMDDRDDREEDNLEMTQEGGGGVSTTSILNEYIGSETHDWIELGDPNEVLTRQGGVFRRRQREATISCQIQKGEAAKLRGEVPLRCLFPGSMARDLQAISEMQWWEAIRWEKLMVRNMRHWARRMTDTTLPEEAHIELVTGAL